MFRSKSNFEKVFEKATSNLLLEPDLDSMLQLCDMIRGGDVKVREAAALIKMRVIEEPNPHVQLFAIHVMDTVMKNCGDEIHKCIITESYLEKLKDLVKTTKAETIKTKLLDMIQAWGVGFKQSKDYKISADLYNIMKAEGYKFPPMTDTADMFKSEKAPTWSDGDECMKCKAEFGVIQRKHHCRACGGVFCSKCTSKQAIIPKFGIEKEVRVCDSCYDSLTKKSKSGSADDELPAEYLNSSLAKQSQEPPPRDEAALKEEEELQLALALSMDEQTNRDRIRSEQINNSVYGSVVKPSTPPAQPHVVDAEVDPDLARYLNRSAWEKKKSEQDKQKRNNKSNEKVTTTTTTTTSNKVIEDTDVVVVSEESKVEVQKQEESLQNGGVNDNEEFLNNLRTSVEIFTNRMRSNKMRGRSIANDSAVQGLFQSINNMHPLLMKTMNELEEKRLQQEALQDKLVQLRDARAALDALRADHARKVRQAAEEAERQRQIQMAHKLELMRQKKQEYLAYQRQMALQRMEEQEAARHARLEQHKQFIQQRAMQPSMLVAGYNTQQLPQQPEAVPEFNQGGGGYMYSNYPQHTNQQHYQQNMSQPYVAQQLPNNYQHQQMPYQQNQAYDQQTYQQVDSNHGNQQLDTYNMTTMAGTLPNPNMTGGIPQQQQVIATAPPQTPQPTNQQMTYSLPHDQQQFYQQQQPQQQQQQQQPQDVGNERNQNLLISFD
uniref:zinc finger protein isoform X1 n=1 Tax=Ciona intestinalis TaxID=7719 RepID=UPI0005219C8C|nr:zinc finger protein isoform X1 [Ciona intestinalis]|eukprot:XP_009861236.1 zinc finger protein isoform X1 [Ciona intestinalis]